MKDTYSIVLNNESETQKFARRVAKQLFFPLILTFKGDIGAGKTTFIRATLQALGVQSAIKSPTYAIVESYPTCLATVHHFDLYRIHDTTELEFIGLRDFFTEQAICCIEWPEQAGNELPPLDVEFSFSFLPQGRSLEITAHSEAGENLLSLLRERQ